MTDDWVIGRANEDQLLAVEGPQLQVGVVDRAPEAELHLVTQHELDDVLRVTGAHRDLDARVARDEALEQVGQDVGADGEGATDGEVSGRGSLDLLQRVAAFDQRAHGALRERHPCAAAVGEAHASWRAQEQFHAQLALEAVQPRGERRLRDEQSFGRAADAASARDLQESLDLQQLQAVDPAASGFVYGQGGERRFYLWPWGNLSSPPNLPTRWGGTGGIYRPHLASPHGGEEPGGSYRPHLTSPHGGEEPGGNLS